MTKPPPVIVWFRNDLRLTDNPALTAAAESGQPVLCLYILDETPDFRPIGPAALWWLEKSLTSLAADLRKMGGQLAVRRGVASSVIDEFIDCTGANAVYWNRAYDHVSVARDASLKSTLKERGLCARSFNASLLNEPWEVRRQDGGDYQIFTSYWRVACSTNPLAAPLPRPRDVVWCVYEADSDQASLRKLPSLASDAMSGLGKWRPGEGGARERLDDFLPMRLMGYSAGRDDPGSPSTSCLSPHLHFGEIGPRQIAQSIAISVETGAVTEDAAQGFMRQLGWRDFYHYILFHRPEVLSRNLRSAFDAFPWRDDPAGLEAWKNGRTGYPIVDAGMRELKHTGWMHNRVRMIVGSFLTKHLLIDWRHGEAWFWDRLVDADLANNAGNWQWVAGTGIDAAPYFRVFNPVLQSARHDPEGRYIRRWIPELERLPAAALHEPWKAPPQVLAHAGVRLGQTYPRPIVDHAFARARALDAYRSLTSRLQTDEP